MFSVYTYSHGDLVALSKIINEWDFKDVESALRYAVAVLSIAKDKKLFYEKENGEKVTIEPADSLKREKPRRVTGGGFQA